MVSKKEAQHIAERFVIHYFSAFGVWFLVYRFATEPLMAASESTVAKIMATAFLIGAVGIKEIFDANKLAKLRGEILKKILKTGATPPKDKILDAINDPRFTLKKSMYDLVGWGAGAITILVLI